MRILGRVLLAILLLLLLVGGLIAWYTAHPNLPEYTPPQKMIHLEEQWSKQDRETYYYTPQGTQVKGLRYDWFTHLEQPFNKDKFASPENLARFGFLIEPEQIGRAPDDTLAATAKNPGNLPVGFARHQDGETGAWYLDITCSACHTGELRYKGTAIRIDGGAAMHSIASTVPTLRGGAFGQALGASLASTYYVPWKFDRFAKGVLGDRYPKGKAALKRDVRNVLGTLLSTAWNDTHRGLYPTLEGPGRADAFGRIANSVFGDGIDASNYRVANAPVNYPQVWDIWKFDWVQWNGSAMQPMARNIGEALGVGATLRLFESDGKPVMGDERYASSVRLRDLYTLEETLKQLKPPTWPKEVFGEIDLKKASQGRALFQANCVYCHGPHVKEPGAKDYIAPARVPEWRMKLVSTKEIGTDPTTADNIADHTFDIRALKLKTDELQGMNVHLYPQSDVPLDLSKISAAKGLAYVTAFVEQRAYRDAHISEPQQQEMNGYGLPIGVQELRAYKARPLDGIWATPPFLHNGSVPNLFQMLSPVAERDAQFWVGSFEYDPKFAGYRTERFPGGFLYKTSVTGNSNRGHEFRDGCRQDGVIGRALSPEERWALVEYLKVLGNAEYESKLDPNVPTPAWTPGPKCE